MYTFYIQKGQHIASHSYSQWIIAHVGAAQWNCSRLTYLDQVCSLLKGPLPLPKNVSYSQDKPATFLSQACFSALYTAMIPYLELYDSHSFTRPRSAQMWI